MKNEKAVPYIVGIPNLGVGLLWAMNMTLIPMLVATYNVSNAKAGILISMGAFTGMFVQYLAGLLSDRSSFKMGKRKPFMLMGSVAATIFMCLMPFSNSYAMLFVFSFMFYFSLNFYQGPYYSLIPETVDENKLGFANGFSRVVSILGAGFIFITGPMLFNSKSVLNKNHCLPFFVAAFLGIITVAVTVLLIEEKEQVLKKKPEKIKSDSMKYKSPKKIKDKFKEFKEKFKSNFIKYKSPIMLFIVIFFVYFSSGCITPFFVKYCKAALHIDESTASLSLLTLTVSGAVFAAPLGILADKIEKRKVLMFGTFLFCVALFTGNLISSAAGLFVIMAVAGVGFIAIQVTSYSILAEIVPEERLGEFMGIFNFFVSISQFIATNAMGFLLDAAGYKVYFPVAAVSMLIATLVIAFTKFQKWNNIDNKNTVNMN